MKNLYYNFGSVLMIVLLILTGVLMVGISYAPLTIPRILSIELGLTIVSILIGLLVSIVSFKVTAVATTVVNVFLEESQRRVFLAIRNGDTFDTIKRRLNDFEDLKIRNALAELTNRGLVKVEQKTVGNRLADTYYRTI